MCCCAGQQVLGPLLRLYCLTSTLYCCLKSGDMRLPHGVALPCLYCCVTQSGCTHLCLFMLFWLYFRQYRFVTWQADQHCIKHQWCMHGGHMEHRRVALWLINDASWLCDVLVIVGIRLRLVPRCQPCIGLSNPAERCLDPCRYRLRPLSVAGFADASCEVLCVLLMNLAVLSRMPICMGMFVCCCCTDL